MILLSIVCTCESQLQISGGWESGAEKIKIGIGSSQQELVVRCWKYVSFCSCIGDPKRHKSESFYFPDRCWWVLVDAGGVRAITDTGYASLIFIGVIGELDGRRTLDSATLGEFTDSLQLNLRQSYRLSWTRRLFHV